ncbi:MAG: TRAP transporter large permease subunit, partial [Bacteroidetes bacterium]
LLMLIGATIDLVFGKDVNYSQLAADSVNNEFLAVILSKLLEIFKFLSDANVALLMAVFTGIYFLGIKQGRKMDDLMKSLGKAAASIAMIVLIIAAGGAFKQVLTDSGVAEYIKQIASGLEFNPLILAWCIAAVLRLAIGSATVATMTAAGIMLPIVGTTGVSPELMVLATGSGSLMFSHFNDIGFWMFKEYYNVSIKQTFAIWTVMESLVAIVGLLAALGLSLVI